jgi:hypothetical protein
VWCVPGISCFGLKAFGRRWLLVLVAHSSKELALRKGLEKEWSLGRPKGAGLEQALLQVVSRKRACSGFAPSAAPRVLSLDRSALSVVEVSTRKTRSRAGSSRARSPTFGSDRRVQYPTSCQIIGTVADLAPPRQS